MLKLASVGTIALAAATLTTACVDPGGRFDDFGNRVVDAGVEPDAPPVAEIPDVDGSFYLSFSPSIAPDKLFRFVATADLEHTAQGPVLDLTLQPLDRETLEAVGEAFTASQMPVSNSAQFEAQFVGTVPGRANPISGSDVTATLIMKGTLRTDSLFCGAGEGEVTKPVELNLTGSTFAAIRIAEGTIGNALPTPVYVCPSGDDQGEDGNDQGEDGDAGTDDGGENNEQE